jgi:signal transduction histidine kinase
VTALALAGWSATLALVVVATLLLRRLELVARAEHELRGPVTAMALAAEAAREPEARRVADSLAVQLDRLRIALADLEAARRGARAPARGERVPLEWLARAAAAGWMPAAERAGRRVTLDWSAGPVTVEADRQRLGQALDNLLANAVEHGTGTVRLSGRATREGVRLEVSDDGLEVGDEGLLRPRRPPAPGRGRGLRIAASAARDAGGRLELLRAESGDGRAGETAAIDLPLRMKRRRPLRG